MNLLFLAVIVIVVAVLLAALKGGQARGEEAYSFESREPFFSPAERSFLGVLEQAVDSRYRIFGKVRLGDLLKPAKGLSKSKRTTAGNKVNQKHVDFVLCSVTDLKVVGVVELDDKSHAREERVERDGFLDHALKCAGIPIARFPAKKGLPGSGGKGEAGSVF